MMSGVTAAIETIDRPSRNVSEDDDRPADAGTACMAPTVAHCAWPEAAVNTNIAAMSHACRVTPRTSHLQTSSRAIILTGPFMRRSDDRPAVTIMAPLSGVLVALEDVPDPVFAQKIVGDGI